MIKKNAKIISTLALVIALGSGATITYAAAATPVQSKVAKNPYISQIKAVRTTIKSNESTNTQLIQSIKQKQQQIKTEIAQLKQSKTLKEKASAIKPQRDKLKLDYQTLKTLNPTIKADWQTVKNDRTAKNYTQLLSDLNNIPSVQTERTQLLQQLSSDLDGMLSILGN
jgi:TolA-binding protein